MHLQFLGKLYAHMEWADAIVWRAIVAEKVLSGDDYLLDTIFHLHLVQRSFLDVWKGKSPTFPERDSLAAPVEIRDRARSYYSDAHVFVSQLTEERLGEPVSLPWVRFFEKMLGGPASPATLGETVFQVPAHSIHHRAQINRRIREVGGTPPLVDYIAWVWMGCPQADWSG